MAQKCFAYVVLATLISLRVMAAPTAAASDDPNPAMCIDRTIPWEERLESCDPCQYPGIPGIPSNVKYQRCAGDGPETHGREQGIFRRDAASTGPQIARTRAHVVLPSRRDSAQTLNTVDESLTVKAVTKGHWIETHDKATGIYARQDILEDSKDVTANGIDEGQAITNYDAIIHKPAPGVWRRLGTLPVGAIAHERAHDISDGGEKPHDEKKRDANPASSLEAAQSHANSPDDVVTHNPASGVWRKRSILPVISLPSGPIVHPQAADVSDGGEKPPAGSKRDTNSLKSQSKANLPNDIIIHKPVSEVWRKRGVIPLGAVVHQQASDVSDGGDEPQSERKREANPVPLSEKATSSSGPHILPRQSSAQDSTPSEAPPMMSETPAADAPAGTTQEDAAQPAPDSIQAAAERFKNNYPYTQPHWTPAIVHEAANDIHRREERVRARE